MEQAKSEDSILSQAREDLDRWSEGDTEGYGRSAADDVTIFNNAPAGPRVDGIQALRELLSALKGQIPTHQYEIVDPKVQVYGTVGILTMQYHGFSFDGEPLVRARATCVYRETEGRWVMVHAHWSAFDDA